jgi:hypothetical protein
MIQNTLMVFGPGGIGKTRLDDIIRGDVLRIDPYRLRKRPRDREENGGNPDLFYAHRNLRTELPGVFAALGDDKEMLSAKPAVEWFPKARTTFFDVRGEWQCLILGSLNAQLAKAEVFGPAVPALFRRQDVREIFGELSIIVLNPVAPLRELNGGYGSLKEATADNCRKAGRTEGDVKKRVNSIDDQEAPEVAAWLAMLESGGIEFPHWPFPEHRYQTNRISTLLEARKTLVERSSTLGEFFKTEDEIRNSA